MSSQPEAPTLSPELVRGVNDLSRALMAATRSWSLYPPEHPAVRAAHERLAVAIQQTTTGAVFSIGVTPHTLVMEGLLVPPSAPVTEAAEFLHDRDLLQITFSGAVPAVAMRTLLTILTLDEATRRERGGPAAIWAREGHPSVSLEQIDYGRVLEDRDQDPATTHDDVWRSIVNSIVGGRRTMDELEQMRLLAIAGDPNQIGDLANAVMAPKCAPDGSPMITTQAVTVLAAFRHLASIVAVKSPDQGADIMRNLAAAASGLNPQVVMEMMQTDDDPTDDLKVVQGMVGAFDDAKVAHLLATALATEGQVTARLAEVFDTIAPDEERKRRVLTLTRTLLSEHDFGQAKQFKAIWSSMEELLISYNEKPFVSEQYRGALDGAGGRADMIATRDLPEELPEWLDSLGQDNVRHLSVILLIDLLKLERDAARAAEIATDMTALAEDLLMSCDYPEAREVAVALAEAAADEHSIARSSCREALGTLAGSAAMGEAVGVLGDFEPEQLEGFCAMCRAIGPPSVDALSVALRTEAETPARLRATRLIVEFGPLAVPRLAPLMDDSRWFVQCNAADILGRIASPAGVPLLQPLLRRGDPKITRHAIAALAGINDPAAARAIHMVLRSATGEQRSAVIAALVAGRDLRVVPMLARILDESEPLGKDHLLVLDALGALKTVHTDQVISSVAALMRWRSWLARRRTRTLKRTAVDLLVTIGSPAAVRTLDTAATQGDRLLRKIVKQARTMEPAQP